MVKNNGSENIEMSGSAKFKISQNMLIAIIGAAATIVAALIPIIINANKPAAEPIVSPTAPPLVPTDTSLPPTAVPTSTLEPVSATPTPVFGLTEVYLALDEDGEFQTTTFAPEQPIYAFFKINDPSELRKVRAVWLAVEVDGLSENTEIYRTEDTFLKSKGSVRGGGSLWNPGKYKLELYLNGQLSSTQEFEIQR